MELLFKHVPLVEVKALGEREFEGYGAVFLNADLGGDVIMPGSFAESITQKKHDGDWPPPMFWMHDPALVPGVWKEIEEDRKGLYVRGALLDTPLGNEKRAQLASKAIRGLSIGYRNAGKPEYDNDGNRLLRQIDLWEISLVSLAMNPMAQVTAAKTIPTEEWIELRRLMLHEGMGETESFQAVAAIKDFFRSR